MFKEQVFAIAAVLAVLPAQSFAAVYQCEKDGQTIFSDRPCGDNAKELDHKPAPKVGSSPATEESNNFVDRRQIERKIRRLENEREKVQRNMDSALIHWQREKQRAANNLAGATWENSLAQEAEVLRRRFQSEIDSIDREIERLREQEANL